MPGRAIVAPRAARLKAFRGWCRWPTRLSWATLPSTERRVNSVVDCLAAHRSIRRYRSDPIPDETLTAILDAATRASSSGNMQTYTILVTKDRDRREALYEMHYRQEMIRQAPVLLTFCADWNRMSHWCRISRATPGYDNFLSFLVGFADALIAAQNATIAAESAGLGVCYMGTTLWSAPKLVEFFELPSGVFPATTLVIGYPDEDPAPRARLPIEAIVHEERYQPFDDERIRATYHARETEGWNRYMTDPRLAKMIHESGVENLAQVYTQLKYTRDESIGHSLAFLAALESQGFFEHD
jgi:nitroreductase